MIVNREKDGDRRRDEVLKRMLKTKPKPRKKPKEPRPKR
jgi:hypothetical protein